MTKSIIAFATLALIACSSDDPPVTNAPVSPPTNTIEADPPTQVDNTPAKGDPSLGEANPATTYVPLLDWSFEVASPDCNGWPVTGSDAAIRAIPAKSGSYSCKVCSNGTTADLALSRELGKVAKGNYTLSAYVRKRAKTAAPGQAIATIQGAKVVTGAPVDVREEWDRIQATIDIDDDSDLVTISIGSANAQADNCLFVDDVVFTRNY